MAFLKPPVIYSARLASLPSSFDRVIQIAFTSGSGTLANVYPGMSLYVGSTAGAYDLGVARIRKDSIAGTFYIGEESDITWQASCYLTVVAEFDIWAKHIVTVSDTLFYMDCDIAYTNQNSVFDPIPIMGGHRVLKLTGSSINTVFNFSNSYVIDSTISSYSCSCPTASGSSGMSTSTPTITFNTAGWHPVYLTVTAANGKSFRGVRYVYVYSKTSMPSTVFQLGNCVVDYEVGGWSFDATMQWDINLADVPERALCILFAEDFYGDTNISIGQLAGCENIICVGKIAEEQITIDPEVSEVTIRVQGMHYWMQKVFAFPTGVIQTTATPINWAEMMAPTVDKVAFRLLHWGSTVTQVMDVYLTGYLRLASELISPASNLWAQLQELAFATIMARPGVDRFGRMFIEVEPQIVPVANRTWATVMTITKEDWTGAINVARNVVSETGMIDLSGVVVNSDASGNAFFSLSPGHVFKHYGVPEIVDRTLLSNQSLSNQQAGMLLGWRNNPYPSTEGKLAENNRMIDCFPRQRVAWTVNTVDSPRGFSLSGYFIPRRVELTWDISCGLLETSLSLELESVEQISSNGDVPGSGDVSTPPPAPDFPPLSDFGILLPIDTVFSPEGLAKIIGHDTAAGVFYSLDFNADSPTYLSMNSGLGVGQGPQVNWVGVCPNGAVYVSLIRLQDPDPGSFIARAPALGQPFTVFLGPPSTTTESIRAIAINPTVPEQIGFVTGERDAPTWTFHVGNYASYNNGANLVFVNGLKAISFGNNAWLATRNDVFIKVNAAGTSVISSGSLVGATPNHMRAGTATGDVFCAGSSTDHYVKITNNGASITTLNTGNGIVIVQTSSGIDYWVADCDSTGRYQMMHGLGTVKAKSSDFGVTIATIPALPTAFQWAFAYAGMMGSLPSFIAAGAVIRYTPDFGITWAEKTTPSLTSLNPFPNINIIRAVGLGIYGNP